MAEKSAKGILLAVVTWFVIIGVLAVAYKYLIHPRAEKKLEGETGSESRYKHELAIAADSFSGYCILRSEALKRELKSKRIKLSVVDDGADYGARMEAIRDGGTQMAAFTVDSLITASAAIGQFPATIVMVIDETKGADAIVAKKGAVGSLQDLDDPDARMVLTPDSPSEFLARTVMAHFSLPRLPEKWWVEADGAEAVYKMFRSAKAGEKRVYVLWEPYVSRAVDEGGQVLLDSSKLKGYIVDVLVAQREFLRDNPGLVRDVVGAYLRAAYSYGRRKGGMVGLVLEDAKATGAERLTEKQAGKLVGGIQWKNTLENYAYFGLLPAEHSGGAQHLEDIITNITRVLVKTGALAEDPLSGKASALFYNKTLAELKAADFHPGKKLDIMEGVGPGVADLEKVRVDAELGRLEDEQWEALLPVGELKVKPISFARGTSRINLQSRRELGRLAKLLQSWPQYYHSVVGHARAEGDAEANMKLARERSRAAVQFLGDLARPSSEHEQSQTSGM